jgi:L-arabinokinase
MTAARAEGRAPGRFDVLGGVADYSGALVLQMPIAATTTVRLETLPESSIRVTSPGRAAVIVPTTACDVVAASAGDAAAGRAWLDEHDVAAWARYPLGCLMLFCDQFSWRPGHGLAIAVESDVPVSMGVSSSAALEVATLRALERLSGHAFAGTALARLAQRAENELVGAPCGLMDQLAAAHGTAGALLPILCRPDVLSPPLPLPPGVVVAGWPSGVAHAVSGTPYGTARTAAFMAKAIIARGLGRRLDHLAEATPEEVATIDRDALPARLSGREFTSRHGGVDDPLSRVDPDRDYPVRAAAEFATGENARAAAGVALLGRTADHDPAELAATLGALMGQSHRGYSAIGLGAPETDAMVEAIRRHGPAHGFYGARVSGGGCGGTVVVLLAAAALPALRRLAAEMTGTEVIG